MAIKRLPGSGFGTPSPPLLPTSSQVWLRHAITSPLDYGVGRFSDAVRGSTLHITTWKKNQPDRAELMTLHHPDASSCHLRPSSSDASSVLIHPAERHRQEPVRASARQSPWPSTFGRPCTGGSSAASLRLVLLFFFFSFLFCIFFLQFLFSSFSRLSVRGQPGSTRCVAVR